MKRIYTAAEVAKHLTQNGFKPLSVVEPDEELDGEIRLSERVHVQVCEFGGLCVVTESGDEFTHWPERAVPGQLMPDLKRALA